MIGDYILRLTTEFGCEYSKSVWTPMTQPSEKSASEESNTAFPTEA